MFGFGNSSDGKGKGSKRGVLRFIFMPDFSRGTKQIGETFQMFVQLIAMMFVTNGMLERTHRFFQPGARYTLTDVYHETRARLDWRDKTKLPQTVFFIAVWGLLAFSVLWMVTVIFSLIVGINPAHADTPATATTGTMFTPGSEDLGVKYINNLFFGDALPGMQGASALVQNAFRSMMAIYSSAILVFASFILLYHIINMVVKAAWEGKALEGAGQIWAPLRLVLAIGMLVPLGSDLNAAQHVVIKVGEMGSALASFAWKGFATNLLNIDKSQEPVVSYPDATEFLKRMVMIHVCKEDINRNIDKTKTNTGGAGDAGCGSLLNAGNVDIGPKICYWSNATGVHSDALNVPVGGIYIVSGKNTGSVIQSTANQLGNNIDNNVAGYGTNRQKDLCGKIIWPRTNLVSPEVAAGAQTVAKTALATAALGPAGVAMGAAALGPSAGVLTAAGSQKPNGEMSRWTLDNKAKEIVFNASKDLEVDAATIAKTIVDKEEQPAATPSNATQTASVDQQAIINELISTAVKKYNQKIATESNAAVSAYVSSFKSDYAASMNDNEGWAKAGAYFMRLSGLQGAISGAFDKWGSAELGPIFTATYNADTANNDWFTLNPKISGNARAMHKGFIERKDDYFNLLGMQDPSKAEGTNTANSQGNEQGIDLDVLLLQFPKDTFVNMIANSSANPLFTLFGVGHFLYGLFYALLIAAPIVGKLTVSAEVGFAVLFFAFYILTPAVLLAFLLPVIPATRFLIGVLSWLGALMEAVLGMPMLALAHLNPKGDTLIDPAKHGYHYLFSIMLKPLFIVFGLIVATLMAAIGISILNSMYTIALEIMWGPGHVFILTALFFAGMYGFQAYGVCNACFKMIDVVPDQIYQWIGNAGYKIHDYDDDKLSNPTAGILFAQGLAQQTQKVLGGVSSAIGKNRDTARQINSQTNDLQQRQKILNTLSQKERKQYNVGTNGIIGGLGRLGAADLQAASKKAEVPDDKAARATQDFLAAGEKDRGDKFDAMTPEEQSNILYGYRTSRPDGLTRANRRGQQADAKKAQDAADAAAKESQAIARQSQQTSLLSQVEQNTRTPPASPKPTYAQWLAGLSPQQKQGLQGRQLQAMYNQQYP